MGCAADGTNTIRCVASSLRLLLLFLLLGDTAEYVASFRAVPGAEVEDVPSFVIAFANSLHQVRDARRLRSRRQSLVRSGSSRLLSRSVAVAVGFNPALDGLLGVEGCVVTQSFLPPRRPALASSARQ